MNEVASIATASGSAGIDHTKYFIPQKFTPLFHTSVYRLLPGAVRLRYNQLHALYFNEQVAFFEQEMLSPALIELTRSSPPANLQAGLRTFFEEEQRHTTMFRALNRRCAPQFYGPADVSYFIRVAPPWRTLLSGLSRRPHVFPLLVWLALLQEERSLYYSKGCLECANDLEPYFVALHRAHLADEVGHIRWDEELLDWLWPRGGRGLRRMNAWLLAWMIREFFLLPKRSGRRVVAQLAREFPQLDAATLQRGMRELDTNAAYLGTLYSREVTPRSFARFDAHPEFALLARTLPGYHPAGSVS
jgi:hypothetical protein